MKLRRTIGNAISASLLLKAAVLFAFLLDVGNATADRRTTKTAPADKTGGLELGLEGADTAIMGSNLRWFFTLYEVVGENDLLPARSGTLKILTSFKPDEPVAVLKTDERGRAFAEIPIPMDVLDFEIVVEASLGAARRSFNMPVSVKAPGRIELVADRSALQPGESVTFVGRAVSEPSVRPISNQPVTVTLTDQDGRSLEKERTVKTSATGVFLVTTKAPSTATEIRIKASLKSAEDASLSVSIRKLEAPRMVILAAPQTRLVTPGSKVPVDVTVRRSDGRPVKGAEVRFTEDAPATSADKSQKKEDKIPKIKTDENGRARLTWTAPSPSGDMEETWGTVWAERAGLDKASTSFSVRTLLSSVRIGVSVEGGDLLPGLPSRIYVRATNADGSPVSKTRIGIASPVVGKRFIKTDADGIAVFDTIPKISLGIEGKDRCGGATATSLIVTIGDKPREAESDDEDAEEEQEDSDEERCVPVDLDGTVRVRPNRVSARSGETLEVELHLSSNVSSFPVELALLRMGNAVEKDASEEATDSSGNVTLVPLSRQIVTGGASRKTEVALPRYLCGEFVLRARPLVGPASIPVRGGTASLFVFPENSIAASVSIEKGAARISTASPKDGVEGTVFVVPADEAEDLMNRLEETASSVFTRFFGYQEKHGKLLDAVGAAHTPRDEGAPAVLRGKVVEVMPAVQNPPTVGILRDPIRARARFVRGRLALAIRTLEARLEELIPDRINDIGMTEPNNHSFNAEALNAVKGSNYLEGRDTMTLGGDPLSLQDLERMDASFTFDNMARRVTRKRLLSMLIRLRSFVRERELDLRVEGQDPTRWIDVLFDKSRDGYDDESYDEYDNPEPEPESLYDGWGRRMAIVSTKNGGPARFRFLTPLPPGFELVSAGPDGRFGTADDMADPFARVLSKGSVYAEAVGEDELMVRLNRVEVNRATLEAVASLFEESADESYDSGAEDAESIGTVDEMEITPASDSESKIAAAFERWWRPIERSAPLLGKIGAAWTMPFTVDDEPRRWSLVASMWTTDGRAATVRRNFDSGFPVILEATTIQRLAPNEPLTISASGALLPGGPNGVTASVEGAGAVHAEIVSSKTGTSDGNTSLSIGPGGGFEAHIRVSAKEEGKGAVTVAVRSADGAGRRTITLPIEVRRKEQLRELVASAAATNSIGLRLNIPKDAVFPKGTLTLVSPDAMENDPLLKQWFERDPALIAWALTMVGREIPGDLLRRLEASTKRDGIVKGELPMLSTACAAAAWAAVPESEATWAPDATVNAISNALNVDERKKLLIDSEMLAALSIAAAPEAVSPLGTTISTIREELRTSVRMHRDDPVYLSRGAAALLLVDSRDIRGKTMLALAKQHLVEGFRGGRVVDTRSKDDAKSVDASSRQGALQLQATAALAVAAHQVGDDALAAELAQGIAAEANTAAALGGQTLFWVLAARAFGVFGIVGDDKSIAVDVSLNKNPPQKVMLEQKPAIISIKDLGPKAEIEIRVEQKKATGVIPFVFASSTYARPIEPLASGPLRAELTGDAGFAGERAAYIATVSNKGSSAVERPVLFIALPAGAELDIEAKEALLRTEGVLSVDDPDPRGTVRLRLKPLPKDGKTTLPVAFLWSAAGRRNGPALTAFPEDRNWEFTVTPQSEIDVPFRPENAF